MVIKLLLLLFAFSLVPAQAQQDDCPAYLEHEMRKLRSFENIDLCEQFSGKPLLIVNTASHCGFTPQFEGLETLHQAYKDKGLAIVGVPSDSFNQAAASEEAAADVCYINYGVTFTMLSQQQVRGPNTHPLFKELARQAGEPSWNFNKYLLDRDGNVLKRFGSMVKPMSSKLTEAVESVL